MQTSGFRVLSKDGQIIKSFRSIHRALSCARLGEFIEALDGTTWTRFLVTPQGPIKVEA